MSAGTQIARGRSAVVHVWGAESDDKVVKVILDLPAAAIDLEESNSVHAYDAGLTPIRCYGRTEVDGHPSLVFDRLHGDALTAVAEKDIRRLPEVSRVLALEHARLHQHVVDGFPDVRDLALSLLPRSAFDSLDPAERTALGERIRALPDGDRPLHLDYHPQNVFVHDGGETGYAIVDWQTTCRGVPAADVAMTRLLLTEAELFPGISLAKRLLYGSVRRLMHLLYWRAYRAKTGVTLDEVEEWMLLARVLRMGLLDIASEHDRLLDSIRRELGARTS